MNNYKIIENRPELTTEEVMAGMSFEMIQKNVPVPKNSSLKALIVWGVGIAVIVSTIFIYRSFSVEPESKKRQILINDTVKESEIIINSDSVRQEEVEDVNDIQIKTMSIINNDEPLIKDDPKKLRDYQPKRCVILLPSYCCYCIPENSKFATSVNAEGIKFNRIDCGSLLEEKGVSCIWLTLITKDSSYVKLEHGLKNFSLLKGKDEQVHPFAIKATSDPDPWTTDFKGRTIKVNYNKEINVLLFFRNAGLKVGGKMRINKFIATITT